MEGYKEKYNKLVEAIKVLQELNPSDGGIQNWVNYNVPEIKESDDRRIKTFIRGLLMPHISYIHLDGDKIMPNKDIDKYRKALAWLDKQESVEEIVKKCKNSWYNEGKIAGQAEGLTNDERYWQGYHDALEKQGEMPATISVDKMAEEFEDFKVMAGRIPSLAEIDAYRKGVNDVLSKVLIKEEKPITIGSKKAEGKLGEMIAASKEPAESGEDKELSRKEVSKKSDKDNKWKWDEDDEKFFRESILIGLGNIDSISPELYSKIIDWISLIKRRLS